MRSMHSEGTNEIPHIDESSNYGSNTPYGKDDWSQSGLIMKKSLVI